MIAQQSIIRDLIGKVTQYIIPLFQREYVWKEKNWETLLENIIELYGNEASTNHFLGAIVTMPVVSVPHKIPKFTLIDGQQRLTTLFILLLSLRDIAREKGLKDLAEKINNTLIINQYEKKSEVYKILPTDKEDDKKSFHYLVGIDKEINYDNKNNNIIKAYNFFKTQILIRSETAKIDLDILQSVIIDRLDIVSIVLSENENAYFVFESLNATGVKLQPSDLIRNYFMMRVHTDEQTDVYEKHWKPIEILLTYSSNNETDSKLPEFIRYYLSSKTNAFVNDRDIYSILKEQESKANDTKGYLINLLKYAKYYRVFFNPSEEKDIHIQKYLINIDALEVNTCYSFLLPCYNDYHEKNISKNEFVEILKTIENYLLRRYICGVESRELNKFFPTLYNTVKNYAKKQSEQAGIFTDSVFYDLSKNSFVDNLKYVLKEKNRKYPNDDEFRKKFKEFDLYGTGTKLQKARLVLRTIEEYLSQRNKEKIVLDSLSIEHIMPQKIEATYWKRVLEYSKNSQKSEDAHQKYLHTIGNLTLTGVNSELSNKSFIDKKEIFKYSKVCLNEYFENIEVWNIKAIEQRTNYLLDICLMIWKSF